MKYFVIVLVFLGFFGTVFAVPEPDPENAFDFSEIVIVGKILSTEIISEPQVTKSENSYSERSGIAIYKVHIEEYLKNPGDTDTVTATGYFLREPHPMAYETHPYDEGQRVLLYLSKNDESQTNTDFIIGAANSRVIDGEICAEGAEFVNGLCYVIQTERQEQHGLPSTFIDALFFMLILLPFFIPGAIIFVVLTKTPRYSKAVRLYVCIPAIIMVLYFLSGLYLGWYPPGYA